jgi:hypothetical protein
MADGLNGGEAPAKSGERMPAPGGTWPRCASCECRPGRFRFGAALAVYLCRGCFEEARELGRAVVVTVISADGIEAGELVGNSVRVSR